ncbi:MAG: DoxX family protein [Patescibacteria group bacterium]
MAQFEKNTLGLLRITLGWLFFYAGITKVIDPAWSAAGYLRGAKTFVPFYQWLASPSVIPVVNFMNEWGLTLLGISLILGIGVRFSSVLGAMLMVLYYLALPFPMPNAHAYIVDEHIVYIFVLLYFAAHRAGRVWGLEEWCANLPLYRKYPNLRSWWG